LNSRLLGLLAAIVLPACALAAGTQPAHDYSQQPARQSPDWLREGVIYQVFPRVFSAGGNLEGVTAQLDRLKALGVDIVWLMPIHPQGVLKSKGPLGSPYAVRDYDAINPAYGRPADLHRLVDEAHKRDLKVIIDIVANHTSWDSVLMKHPDWYVHDAAGHIAPAREGWDDVAKLDYRNPQLRRYMTGMLVNWLREYDLDGFRCDVAGDVPTDFWEQARPELEHARPGLMMLAEAEQPDLLASAFDADYSWSFYDALAAAIAGGAPASSLQQAWQRSAARFERGALHMHFSDNHDEMRAIGQFGLPASLAASAIIFTMDGVPLLYNGMEVGDTAESGAPALFERIPILWSIAERRPGLPAFYQKLIALRHAHSALTHGAVRWLHNGDESRIVSFERGDGAEQLVVTVNLSSVPFAGIVEAGAGDYQDITPDWQPIPASLASRPEPRVAALPAVTLKPWEFRVFKRVAVTH